jgi:hypothetical protein
MLVASRANRFATHFARVAICSEYDAIINIMGHLIETIPDLETVATTLSKKINRACSATR